MIGVIAAALAGYGVFLLYTAAVFGWRGLFFVDRGHDAPTRLPRQRARAWLERVGLSRAGAGAGEVLGATVLIGVFGAVLAFALFGGLLPAALTGAFAASFPLASMRARRQRRLATAREQWPRLLEELRLLTGSLGRSIPQALFEVGRKAPPELGEAFALAEREWLLTTDFPGTLAVLRKRLADPTADAICETLAVAQEVGGGDLDGRLAELIEDRVVDLQARKESLSKQAGVRFARRFVLLVPLGMALAGLSIGTGRSAYETTAGQLAVAAGILAVVICWLWSGRLMRLPDAPRVFPDDPDRPTQEPSANLPAAARAASQ